MTINDNTRVDIDRVVRMRTHKHRNLAFALCTTTYGRAKEIIREFAEQETRFRYFDHNEFSEDGLTVTSYFNTPSLEDWDFEYKITKIILPEPYTDKHGRTSMIIPHNRVYKQ